MKLNRKNLLLAASAVVTVVFTAQSLHANQIWDGGSSNDNWGSGGNWGSNLLPNFANAITFTGATRLTPFNNLAADTTIGGINFTNTSTNAFTLTGARITLGGNIVTTAATSAAVAMTDTIGLDMILNAERTITTGANHNILVSGIISQDASNRNLIKGGVGTLTLSNANTYAGTTSIAGGTLRLADINAVSSSSSLAFNTATGNVLQIGTDTAFVAANLPSISAGFNSSGTTNIVSDRATTGVGLTHALGALSIGNTQMNITAGTNVTSGTAEISFTSVGMSSATSAEATTFNPTTANMIVVGAVTGSASTGTHTLVLGGTSTGNSIGGVIGNGGRTTQNLSKSDQSTWNLSGTNNTYNGTTTINRGTLRINSIGDYNAPSSIGAPASGDLVIGSGNTGVLDYVGAGDSTNRTITVGSSTATHGGGAFILANGEAALTFTAGTLNTVQSAATVTRTLTLGGAGIGAIDGKIQDNNTAGGGKVAVTKKDAGTWTLGGNSDYTGATNITAGTLLVNGSLAAASAVTVGASGTLGGNGTVNGTLALTGALAPGAAGVDIQNLKAGTTTWNGGSIWNFDLSSVNATSDKLEITGDFVKGTAGTYGFNFMGSTPVWNTTYTLATWTVSTTFAVEDFDLPGAIASLGAGSYSTSSFGIVGNTLTFTAVPEPTSALVGLLVGAGLLRRRRH